VTQLVSKFKAPLCAMATIVALLWAVPAAWAQEPEAENDREVAAAEDTEGETAAAAASNTASSASSAPLLASPLKLVAFVLVYLPWVLTVDWINRSSQQHELGFRKWNPIAIAPFAIVALLSLFVPFVVSYPLLWVSFLGVLISYAVVHNKAVEQHHKVFTGDWFRHTTASTLGKIGIKMQTERKADYEKGPAVDILALGGNDTTNNANLVLARQSPGYIMIKELVAEMVARRSERVMLDYTQSGVSVRHLIDGVWHPGEAREREGADVMLAVMKQLANLKPSERRAKQEGVFGANYQGTKYKLPITSQGVQTGERVLVSITGGKQEILKTYDDLGMRDKIRDVWSELLAADEGLLVMSAMPEGGLTTLFDVSLRETDRLMRDFVSIQDERSGDAEIENVLIETFNGSAGESPATKLPTLLRSYPNVLVVRDFVNEESAAQLIAQVDEHRLVITQCHARSAAEALLRMLQKKVPHKPFAMAVTAVICTRLIRKLCESCKVAYEPAPELLKKLGIPAGKVQSLYRPPQGEEIEKPCEQCSGVGYLGRTGLFELLVVNDQVREVLIKQPKIELLQKAARLAGMRTFQEEAILLVAKGTTSLEEAMRVLK
jgi:type II secretory ATPase GspE/PulE/Tfp pilus assembly ATPase PilB-like protein